MPKNRPTIGQQNWGQVLNDHLSQLSPNGGGINYGTTAQRPILNSTNDGYIYFDITTNQILRWTGFSWEVIITGVSNNQSSQNSININDLLTGNSYNNVSVLTLTNLNTTQPSPGRLNISLIKGDKGDRGDVGPVGPVGPGGIVVTTHFTNYNSISEYWFTYTGPTGIPRGYSTGFPPPDYFANTVNSFGPIFPIPIGPHNFSNKIWTYPFGNLGSKGGIPSTITSGLIIGRSGFNFEPTTGPFVTNIYIEKI